MNHIERKDYKWDNRPGGNRMKTLIVFPRGVVGNQSWDHDEHTFHIRTLEYGVKSVAVDTVVIMPGVEDRIAAYAKDKVGTSLNPRVIDLREPHVPETL